MTLFVIYHQFIPYRVACISLIASSAIKTHNHLNKPPPSRPLFGPQHRATNQIKCARNRFNAPPHTAATNWRSALSRWRCNSQPRRAVLCVAWRVVIQFGSDNARRLPSLCCCRTHNTSHLLSVAVARSIIFTIIRSEPIRSDCVPSRARAKHMNMYTYIISSLWHFRFSLCQSHGWLGWGIFVGGGGCCEIITDGRLSAGRAIDCINLARRCCKLQ